MSIKTSAIIMETLNDYKNNSFILDLAFNVYLKLKELNENNNIDENKFLIEVEHYLLSSFLI